MRAFLSVLFMALSFICFGQAPQNFKKSFETPSGIYGYVTLSTQPTTVGFGYIWIQQNSVVVEGARIQGENFVGSSLSNYGVRFPFNCSNCFFYADGQASMPINGTSYYGNFNKGGTVNLGGMGKTNQSVYFSETAKNLHNEAVKEMGFSLWEKRGRVETINIYGVKGGDFGKITSAARNYTKDKQKANSYDRLITQANQASTDQEKLRLLNDAKQYANNSQKIALENKIQNIRTRLENTSNQENNQDNTVTQNQGINNNQSTDIGNIASVRRNTNTVSTPRTTQMYDANGLPTTAKIEAIKRESQARYNRKAAQIELITNAAVGVINYFQQQREIRLKRERIQREKQRIEKQRQKIFYNQADTYREEYKKMIDARVSFVNQPYLKSTLKEQNADFQPLYIYYAFVKKNYNYYSETVSYPNTLKFYIHKDVDVNFSPVFGFFPYSNGEYPFIKNIKKQILEAHFDGNKDEYDVFFFPWQNSVDKIVSSLKSNLNNAVNQHYFASAIPSSNNKIVFLNNKVNPSQGNNYWETKDEKKKDQAEDYWNLNTPKEKINDSIPNKNN